MNIQAKNQRVYVVTGGKITERELPDHGSIKLIMHNGELRYIEYESKEKINK